MNVFDFAIQMEEECRDHYEKLAAAARSDEVKRVFSILADSEREHREHLVVLKSGSDALKSESTLLDQQKDRIRHLVENLESDDILASDSDGYRHAIRAEEESIELYETMAADEPNPAAGDLLHMLAEEERHHLQVIENIYDFVETPRTYLAWGEFSNLREY